MTTLMIEKPLNIKVEDKVISKLMTMILNEYNDFDINLMKKYYETKNLDESNFTNI